jgi:hypothetical protein
MEGDAQGFDAKFCENVTRAGENPAFDTNFLGW